MDQDQTTSDDGKRRYERIACYDRATFTLSSGRTIPGKVQDMGFGGYSFISDDDDLTEINHGDTGKIEVTLFGRVTHFDCEVAHVSDRGIGLRIPRIYEAPEVLNVTE